MIEGLGDMSLSLAFAAIGSAFGTGFAGMAAVGAWKKHFRKTRLHLLFWLRLWAHRFLKRFTE